MSEKHPQADFHSVPVREGQLIEVPITAELTPIPTWDEIESVANRSCDWSMILECCRDARFECSRYNRFDFRPIRSCTNSHSFRGHPAGSLLISSWGVDSEIIAGRLTYVSSATIVRSPGSLIVDGNRWEVYESVDFTSLFRGWKNVTRRENRELKRRDRAWRVQIRQYERAARN